MEVFIELLKGIILVVSIIVAIISTIKTIKSKRQQGETVDFTTILNENIIKYMQGAETMFGSLTSVGSKSGALKETDVLNKLKIDCLTRGIVFDEQLAKNKIKELIEFSKTVNK